MKIIGMFTVVLFGASAFAQAPANAPAGSTGLCVDGTYFSGADKAAACKGHQGIEVWWGTPTKKAAPPVARDSKDKATAPTGTLSPSPSETTTDGKAVAEKAVPPKPATH